MFSFIQKLFKITLQRYCSFEISTKNISKGIKYIKSNNIMWIRGTKKSLSEIFDGIALPFTGSVYMNRVSIVDRGFNFSQYCLTAVTRSHFMHLAPIVVSFFSNPARCCEGLLCNQAFHPDTHIYMCICNPTVIYFPHNTSGK